MADNRGYRRPLHQPREKLYLRPLLHLQSRLASGRPSLQFGDPAFQRREAMGGQDPLVLQQCEALAQLLHLSLQFLNSLLRSTTSHGSLLPMGLMLMQPSTSQSDESFQAAHKLIGGDNDGRYVQDIVR